MCGIYGTTIPYEEIDVLDKLKRTSFRGPDQLGFEKIEKQGHNVSFGHNRLSIIDLDPRSNQPFRYMQKTHIVFNGEIFNFRAIRDNLEKEGYVFNTTSDTEVVCAAYELYGEDCVNHFNGMFAFVIYDKGNNKFFGARDRLGQKPFYYYHKGLDFEFSSQISSIQLKHSGLSISKASIESYLMWGYVPDTKSIFNEIATLPAGHSFQFYLESGELSIKQYWDIDTSGEQNFNKNYITALGDLEELLTDSVRLRLFADVPVGIFLSGGVDSSLIAALASKGTSEKVKTFSVKFDNKKLDESEYATKVASHLRTEHTTIECDYKEGLDLIENFSYYYDEPFSDSSALPSMLLAKHTKKHVTVALSGDGGDELFLGYQRYNWMKYISNIYALPNFLRAPFAKVIERLPNYRLNTIAHVLNQNNINEAYMSTMSNPSAGWLKQDLSYDNINSSYLFNKNKSNLERVSDFDIKTYLNLDINTKVDRASMANSLEVRSPLMDYRVVEFAKKLPTSFKFKGNNQKRILKDVLYKYVPKNYFDRPKAGFTMPFKDWFRDELKSYVLDELNEESLAALPCIRPKEVLRIIEDHMNGSSNNYTLIWRLLVLKQWLKSNGSGFVIT
ncbi:asparagine synthase (glutamine-hydrolyzing) [Maribacter sp. MJ134]|uniref:asparagine synthase (glutamine-hydrolyzing) n=1 Tax=Maribacter sp. MJ134 TaxID=2496865 RepID=UPI000F82E81A|nr:asparagine synthase (glutamine-hydrolyzing) [Maribacter sp. MJ134]AZQ58477.1 asparagine synthase (glutamine-hydrolyzing) [Maribacter sp. MJ134]